MVQNLMPLYRLRSLRRAEVRFRLLAAHYARTGNVFNHLRASRALDRVQYALGG